MNAIEARDVRKVYRRYSRRKQFATLKSALLSRTVVSDLRPDEMFVALKGVTFDVPAGRTMGLIGRNGSGKSTMLKLIAGIGRATSGSLTVEGRVSALIELGAGFHPEISGRENVFINGMMLGLTRREVSDHFADIVRFAELEEFIEQPVKTYSSGMYMRLGFAVAIHVDPDVLLVDEVLAVGDEGFTRKCLDKFAEFRRRGKTILLVSHSLNLVERFCDEVLWLDQGVVKGCGDPRRIIDEYRLDVARDERERLEASTKAAPSPAATDAPASATNTLPADMFKADEGRWGTREVQITEVQLKNGRGEAAQVFASGDTMSVRLHVRAARSVTDFVFGIGIFNAEGTCCYGTNTQLEGAIARELNGEADVAFVIDRLDLVDGSYKLDVAVHRANGVPYDYHRLLYSFRVTAGSKEAGIYRPPHRWTFAGNVQISGLE